MTKPLDIKMVQGWSVYLGTNNDEAFKWKATAIKFSEQEDAIGKDAQSTLATLAVKCGMLPGDLIKAYGL